MNGKKKILWAIILLSFTIAGCSGDDQPPEPVSAKLNISFTQYNQGEAQQYDTMMYVNAAGNPYLVNEIQYFVSDVNLHYTDDTRQLLDTWKDIHYVDTDLPETQIWQVYDDIKPGEIEKVSFTFGISEQKNQSLKFLNPPERDMFWPEYLGGGYHYMKLNGKWLADDGMVKPFDFHLGIGQIYAGGVVNVDSITGFVQNYFEVELPGSAFTAKGNETSEIEIRMHVENWFRNPNTYNHNDWGGDIMQKQDAMHLGCENGKEDVFSFHLN
ncbi:MAG: MbnP family protein [Bacteroidales bacterium]